MRAKLFSTLLIAGCTCALFACATTHNKGYVICNDLDANVTCPSDTANVQIEGM